MTRDAAPKPPRPRRRRHAWRWALLCLAAALATPTLIALSNRQGWGGRPYVISVNQLGGFPFDQRRDGDDAIPADRRALDGRKVVLIGGMYAPNEASSRVREFQVVDEAEYTRREPPLVQAREFATIPAGTQVPNMTGRAVEVRGTLRVGVQRDASGDAESMFRIEADRVGPAPAASSGPAFGDDPLFSCFCTVAALLCCVGVGWVVSATHRRDLPPRHEWPGRCMKCGYDLRCSTERCPECGTFFGRRETT